MKTIRHSARLVLASALLLGACSTMEPLHGDAVVCDVCDTIWIRLFETSGAPGVYRLNHEAKRRPCRTCEALAMNYFSTGEIPKRCPECGGQLALRPVTVTQ
jgi:hypothetical protein